jgi:hypothetical protein
MLVTAAEGQTSLAVVKDPGTERIVAAAGELEDIVAESLDVETRLTTEHTVAVAVAVPLG